MAARAASERTGPPMMKSAFFSRMSFSRARRASLTGTPGSRSRVSITSTLEGALRTRHVYPACSVDLVDGKLYASLRIPAVEKGRREGSTDDDRLLGSPGRKSQAKSQA